jgi:hypothetical protein
LKKLLTTPKDWCIISVQSETIEGEFLPYQSGSGKTIEGEFLPSQLSGNVKRGMRSRSPLFLRGDK